MIISMSATGVSNELRAVAKNLRKELGIAAWNTAKKGKTLIAKDVLQGQGFNAKLADVKKVIVEKRNDGSPTASSVELKKSKQIPIRNMKPEQTSTGGQFRPTKKGDPVNVRGAFMGPRPGVSAINLRGALWIRDGEKRRMKKGNSVGHMRQPIRRVGSGIYPAKIHIENNRQPIIISELKVEMDKQIARRLRFNTLKQSGAI
jgi:hypothetical protein